MSEAGLLKAKVKRGPRVAMQWRRVHVAERLSIRRIQKHRVSETSTA